MRSARACGDQDAEAVALISAAADHLEFGDRDGWRQFAAAAERTARRRRLPYVLYSLCWMRLSLATMAGDDGAADRWADELTALLPQVSLPAADLHAAAIVFVRSAWDRQRLEPLAEPMAAAADLDIGSYAAQLALGRTDRLAQLRALVDARPVRDRVPNWCTASNHCTLAESAALLHDAALAGQARAVLDRLDGRFALTGISMVLGPVAGYAALARAVGGDHAAAAGLADRAIAIARHWELPVYVDWLTAHRTRLGF